MDRMHVRNGVILGRYSGETGWIELENGSKVSPIIIGFVDGNDKVLPVREVVNNTGSGKYVKTQVVEEVLADEVVITTTITTMTPQEIDETTGTEASAISLDPYGKLHKLELAGLFWIVNDIRTRHSQPAITVGQFLTNLDSFAAQFPDQKFIDKMKSILKT